jgi:outer membrane protein OmpA-like peptidoglycan-associated protein
MKRYTIPLLLALAVSGVRPVEAQLAKRISQAIKQKVGDRSKELQDSITKRATEPVDSALVRSNSVDSLASKASSKAGQVVSQAGRRSSMGAEEMQVRDGLTNGGFELTANFERNKSVISGQKSGMMQALAKVLAELPNVILIQGRADPGLSRAAAQKLGERRALAMKAELVSQGIQANRIFTAAGGVAQPGMAPLFVQRIR